MPQMAPLWWSSLFLMFFLSFMMMCVIMHFQNTQEPVNKTNLNFKTKMMNWKW